MKTVTMIKLMAVVAVLFFAACQNQPNGNNNNKDKATGQEKQEDEKKDDVKSSIAEGKGVGEVEHVELTDPLVESMIVSGKSIYEMKCAACHKLEAKRVVGPGWEGITNKRKPEWIMNMTTNVDAMLAEDPEAQKLLEECMVRMPNQGLSIGDARDVLEFMRKNDLERTGQKDQAVTI